MPFPRDLLDIVICSYVPDVSWDVQKLQSLMSTWEEKEWIDEHGRGISKDHPVEGGFSRLMIDKPEKILLYANHQGGYKVLCPVSFQNIARAFSEGVEAWRKGGERVLYCPLCNVEHALEEAVLKPNGSFSKGAVILRGVHSIHFSQEALADIESILGKTAIVYRRLS